MGDVTAVREAMAAASTSDTPPPAEPLFGSTFTEVTQDYTLGKKLGSGNFAKVVLGELKREQPQWKLKTGDHVAIKVVKKPSNVKRAPERVQMLRAEVEILRSINHPNIVRLYEIYESPQRLYLVMDLLTGGELFDRIVGLGKYSEEDARYFTFKLLNAVLYLHDRNICHRDLKPENILLASPDPDAELKITDFGLSKIAAGGMDDLIMTTRCGTPGYVAPEVLAQEVTAGQLRQYGTSCDMWSVGVIVYILLSAAPPFFGKTDAEMNRRIKLGQYKFPDKYWANISEQAKDFICRLLAVDPNRRMSAAEALQHDWMISIGVHTSDLFALSSAGASAGQSPSMLGVPVMQARFGEFNQGRRGEARAHQGIRDLLALPEDEEELHHFRCSHANKTGHLVVTPAHLGFLAYDQSTMLSVPIAAIVSLRPARAMTWASASDNSLVITTDNGKAIQLDGFWERDECMSLLEACGRWLKHPIAVEEEGESSTTEGAPTAGAPAEATPAVGPSAVAAALAGRVAAAANWALGDGGDAGAGVVTQADEAAERDPPAQVALV